MKKHHMTELIKTLNFDIWYHEQDLINRISNIIGQCSIRYLVLMFRNDVKKHSMGRLDCKYIANQRLYKRLLIKKTLNNQLKII